MTLDGCTWHEGDTPIEDDDCPSCDNCQRLLDTRFCEACGKEFLNWEAEGYDDVMAAPRASSEGDLCCTGCIGQVERELAEGWEDEDDADDLGEF